MSPEELASWIAVGCSLLGLAGLWLLQRRAARLEEFQCVSCGNPMREGELAAFVPCYGDEAHPAVRAGAWCHHDCLDGHLHEVAWTIEDVLAAGFRVKQRGDLKKVALPRAELPQ